MTILVPSVYFNACSNQEQVVSSAPSIWIQRKSPTCPTLLIKQNLSPNQFMSENC